MRRSDASAAHGRGGVAALFLAPSLGFGALLFLAAFLLSVVGAFTEWDGLSPPAWIGFGNFARLLDPGGAFLRTLGVTLVFAFGQLALGLPLAILLALAAHGSARRDLWRSLFWLPMVTNIVAVAYIWSFILSDGDGLLDQALSLVGLRPVGWLTDPDVALASLILVFVWMHLGQQMLVLIDALDAIEPSIVEAARLDGANAFQTFAYVLAPLLRPTILFLAITGFVQAMSTFVLMLVLTGGGPAQATETTPLLIYRMAFDDLRIGRALAAGQILLLVVLALSLVQLRLLRRGGLTTESGR